MLDRPVSRQAAEPATRSLADLSFAALDTLWQAHRRAAEAFLLYANQPRVTGLLEEELDRAWEAHLDAADDIVAEAERRVPVNDEDCLARARLLVRSRIDAERWAEVGEAWTAGLPKGP